MRLGNTNILVGAQVLTWGTTVSQRGKLSNFIFVLRPFLQIRRLKFDKLYIK